MDGMTDAMNDAAQVTLAPSSADSADATDTNHIGQAITCGGWSLALNLVWTNAIIDTFELVKIPRSPNWLLGAVNVDGNIIPVVDLSVYFVPNAPPMQIDRHHRLLVGGKRDESIESTGGSGSDSVFAIMFTGLPMQIQYTREPVDEAVVIPERLRELCIGTAKDGTGKTYFEMNTDRFIEYLSLSLI
jgi:chemotaxis signal transduction protein